MVEQANGGFSNKALKRRRGKVANEGLMRVIREFVPVDKSVIDIGAGIGQFVRQLRSEGRVCRGIDGSAGVAQETGGDVGFVDLSLPIWNFEEFRSDWGLFFEVGEHIDVSRESVVISNVDKLVREGLIMSWAIPGQRGRGHINCRLPEYIASVFALHGWVVQEEKTKTARQLCDRFYRNRLMVLEKVTK